MKCRVTGVLKLYFDIDVDAEHEDDAMQAVQDMDHLRLVEAAKGLPEVEIDGCLEIKAPRKKRARKSR
jgi:hypothetical protein